jgi:hypothetical protein
MHVQERTVTRPSCVMVSRLHSACAYMMTHSDPPSEPRPGHHRRAPRVRPGPLRVRLHRTCEGILVDISASGVLVQVPWSMSRDRQVTVNLDVGDTPLQLRGRVVRSMPHKLQMAEATLARTEYHVAVAFSELPDDQVAALQKLLKSE